MSTAIGPFEVKLTPLEPQPPQQPAPIGRMSLDKQFHGDLEAVSQGQMLAAGTAVKGSAGYVALEVVSGSLDGRSGSFVLQHNGIMNRGVPLLSITVVPDSGTDELAGLAGEMKIDVQDGKHTYVFEYSISGRDVASQGTRALTPFRLGYQ